MNLTSGGHQCRGSGHVLHHQLITVEWSADGPQYVRPPWTGMVETLYMRLQATQERLPFRVRTTAQARTAAEVVGVREVLCWVREPRCTAG